MPKELRRNMHVIKMKKIMVERDMSFLTGKVIQKSEIVKKTIRRSPRIIDTDSFRTKCFVNERNGIRVRIIKRINTIPKNKIFNLE